MGGQKIAVANPVQALQITDGGRAGHRSSDFAAAPARGLTLIGVDYPPDDELASRITVTRDVRRLS